MHVVGEASFYEDGAEIATRIRGLVPQVAAERVADLAVEARERMKLRTCRCCWCARWRVTRRIADSSQPRWHA
jgi:hypothetical protein